MLQILQNGSLILCGNVVTTKREFDVTLKSCTDVASHLLAIFFFFSFFNLTQLHKQGMSRILPVDTRKIGI